MASTTNAQRIGIWVIVIILAVGTLTSFVAIIFSNQNDQTDRQKLVDACTTYKTALVDQDKELSDKYYDTLNEYSARVEGYDKATVTELKTEDLKVGDGEEITDTSTYAAYYIGWGPDGKVFDQSIDGDTLKAPLIVQSGRVIEGWGQGVKGMKVGGIRQLTIPSELAYGDTGNGNIGPDTPLTFVMMIIPTPDKIELPEALKPYEAAINYYGISYACS